MRNIFPSAKIFKLVLFFNNKGKDVKIMHDIRFIDSFKFLASSLDKLASNLGIDQFIQTMKYFGEENIDFISRKGVYPYEYVKGQKSLKKNFQT